MPRLRELDAEFLTLSNPTGSSHRRVGDRLAGADGLQFLCPKCFAENAAKHGDGRLGTHMVICWFIHVGPAVLPGPGRWLATGTSVDDVTFVPSPGRSSSVALLAGCLWHGFVKDGAAD